VFLIPSDLNLHDFAAAVDLGMVGSDCEVETRCDLLT